MDSDLILQQFEEIERRVERLIAVCQSQEETNSRLRKRIEELEKEIHNRIEAERSLQEGKASIRSKIDSLLVRLEDITDAYNG